MRAVIDSLHYLLRSCDTRRAGTRFSEDPVILRDSVRLEENLWEYGAKVDPLACVRRAVRGIL